MPARVYVDTSHTAQTNARTGIQMVVRGMLAGLASRGCEVYPLRWSFGRDGLTPLRSAWEHNLGRPPGAISGWNLSAVLQPRLWPTWVQSRGMNHKTPIHRHPDHQKSFHNGWLILPELMEGYHARQVITYARRQNMRIAGIFHDAIAWFHPEVVWHWTKEQHADYMLAFSGLDVVIAVSEYSARHYQEFLRSQNRGIPTLRVCPLAAEISGSPRETQPCDTTGNVVRILCVSTLEPRKNHSRILNAFHAACSRSHGVRLELHLVGASYDGAPEIAGTVRALTQKNPAIIWHENIRTETLRDLYRECDFTVFGSWIEGFGLPVVESLWFGKPCLCANQGVMAENARGGGCLTVDVQDTEALTTGLLRLACDEELRRRLANEALARKMKTWGDFGAEVLAILDEPKKS
ncbi:MAG: glycosyltransferase [Terrimicrobiaceae bacterium]